MILNVYTIVGVFLAGVGGLLALGVFGLTVGAWWRSGRSAVSSAASRAVDDRIHLIELMLGVLLVVRVLAWPHFYLILKSYVEELAVFGVMCVFGVTRIQPELVLASQVLKPVALLGIGFWCLVSHVDRRTHTGSLRRTKIVLAIPVSALVLSECVIEIVYAFSSKIGQQVTCCTQFLETAAATAISGEGPFYAIGLDSESVMGAAYLILHVGVVALALFLRKRTSTSREKPQGGAAILSVILACVSLLVTRWAWVDVLAPIVLQLPYHHCLYELLTDTPVLGAAAVFTLAGHGGLFWALGLHFFRRHAEGAVSTLQVGVYGLSAVAITTELVIVGVHCV